MTCESCCCVGELNLAGLMKWIWKWCTLSQAGRKTELGYVNGQRMYRSSVHSGSRGHHSQVPLLKCCLCPELLAGRPLACRCTSFSVYLVPHSQSWLEEGRGNLLGRLRIVFILLKVYSVLEAVIQKSISENRSS